MDKKKVALFSIVFLPFSQAFVYEELIHHKKFDLEVFCKRIENRSRFEYESVNAVNSDNTLISKVKALLYAVTTINFKFINRFKKEKFDLIHAQFGPGSIYALYYSIRFNIPLIVTFGGYDVPLLLTKSRFNPKHMRYWLLSKLMLKRAKMLLPVSKDLADKLIKAGASPDKIEVFHRGIVIPEFKNKSVKYDKETIKIVMIGRFVEKKGFEYGIEAIGKTISDNHDIFLTIIGDGPLKSKYLKLIKQYSIESNVEIISQMSQKKLFDKMSESDIIIVPSVVAKNGDTEGITNVLKEACARGLPAIITNHGGNIEIVEDGATGFIVPEKDSEAIYQKIILFADNPELITKMGNAAAKKIKEELDIDHTNEILELLYEKVLLENQSLL